MTEISMNKVIHSAIRRDIDRFIAALTDFPAGDRARAQQLGIAWDNFDQQLTNHHEGEHETAWPTLVSLGVSRDLLDTLDGEHEAMASALGETRSAMKTLTRVATADAAKTALTAFENLQTVTLKHLEHEEAELEPVYLKDRDTPEMKAMGKKFSKVGPSTGGVFFTWLLDGAGPDEQRSVKQQVPGPVLTILGFFGRSYRKNVAPVWHN